VHERIKELAEIGQSLWYDYIRRGMIASGELKQLVEEGIAGVTSNPTILHQAITESDDYDEALAELIAEGSSAADAYESLVTADIRAAADVLRPVYERTRGRDGYVSLEVDPALAHDTDGTVAAAERLFAKVGRPNLMIKVPGTEEGLPAISALLATGINVNVTLIFSCDVYRRVIDAYLAGLEGLAEGGGDPSRVASVASFFVSRVDTKVDKVIDARVAKGDNSLARLRGTAANANAKVAYSIFKEVFAGERFARLAADGAHVQRPLWASTSTKDPQYPDTYYVDPLIGPDTVNTIPPVTLEAFKDHGAASAALESGMDQARQALASLAEAGIDLAQVTEELRTEGVAAFAKSFDALMSDLGSQMAAV
jgi:transaldolase/transaldolase/glucose-6-phosphate isomerase